MKCKIFQRRMKRVKNFGADATNWRGGRRKHSGGYVLIYKPEHPRCNKERYVLEHRLVMEKKLGRYLRKNEIVHHINGIKNDNRECNLLSFSLTTHNRCHAKTRYKKEGGVWYKFCKFCNKYLRVNRNNFYIFGKRVHTYCKKHSNKNNPTGERKNQRRCSHVRSNNQASLEFNRANQTSNSKNTNNSISI